MKNTVLGISIILSALFASYVETVSTERPQATVQPAHFHHLHLNSVDPSAAVEYYTRAFPEVTKASLAGFEAFKTTSRLSSLSGHIYILFSKVETAPLMQPQSAISHFGWNTPDARGDLERFHALKLQIVPLYADPDSTAVETSSDAFPGYLTKRQVADAKAKGMAPTRKGGFEYLKGPDGALIENFGDFPAERFTHVHMFHKDPVCAQRWYVTHLGATVAATHLHLGPRSTSGSGTSAARVDRCERPYAEPTYPAFVRDGRVREPSGYVLFDDIGLPMWPYPAGGLVSTRRQTVDHIGLSVVDLKSTVARLKKEGVVILEEIHRWGNTHAAMIEGPDQVALELIDGK
jgi:catechol 2,3-dioxygenase-like lactoylglutathione lyase family enzyme